MRLSQPAAPTTLLRFPSAFVHLRRAIKARIHLMFEPCVPNLTLNNGAPLPSTRKGESHFTSTGAKRRPLFSPLRWSPPTSPPWLPGERTSRPKPMDVKASNESPIVILDTMVVQPSTISVPVLPLPLPIGTKITDRFWPEEDAEYSDRYDALWHSGPASPVNMLTPPPYHRRSRSADVPSIDNSRSHDNDRRDSLPLHFSF